MGQPLCAVCAPPVATSASNLASLHEYLPTAVVPPPYNRQHSCSSAMLQQPPPRATKKPPHRSSTPSTAPSLPSQHPSKHPPANPPRLPLRPRQILRRLLQNWHKEHLHQLQSLSTPPIHHRQEPFLVTRRSSQSRVINPL